MVPARNLHSMKSRPSGGFDVRLCSFTMPVTYKTDDTNAYVRQKSGEAFHGVKRTDASLTN